MEEWKRKSVCGDERIALAWKRKAFGAGCGEVGGFAGG
jgi:hypothetical protein